jgi:hypothetical protein
VKLGGEPPAFQWSPTFGGRAVENAGSGSPFGAILVASSRFPWPAASSGRGSFGARPRGARAPPSVRHQRRSALLMSTDRKMLAGRGESSPWNMRREWGAFRRSEAAASHETAPLHELLQVSVWSSRANIEPFSHSTYSLRVRCGAGSSHCRDRGEVVVGDVRGVIVDPRGLTRPEYGSILGF